MIRIQYDGGLGNNLFQYCVGRVIAQKMGYALDAEPIPGFPGTYEKIDGLTYNGKDIQLDTGLISHIGQLIRDKPKSCIHLTGFGQRYQYYHSCKSQVKEWLRFDPAPTLPHALHPSDIVIHVRRGDYVTYNSLLPAYAYEAMLEKALAVEPAEHVYLLTDSPNDSFVQDIYKEGIIAHNDRMSDLYFLTQSNRIIMSASTFSWWGAFLSQAKEIYYPLEGHWNVTTATWFNDLMVSDESRYTYLSHTGRKAIFWKHYTV